MASNILSRLLPTSSEEPLPFDDPAAPPRRTSSENDRLSMDLDEENLGERFQDQDLEHLLADATSSQITTESTAFLAQNNNGANPVQPNTTPARQQWRRPAPTRGVSVEEDDDVPESLLLEGDRDPSPAANRHPVPAEGLPPPVPGPATRRTRAQWEATRRQHRLHDEGRSTARDPQVVTPGKSGHHITDPREKALWYWANVTDLDAFLHEVYAYHMNSGIWSILLRRVLMLLQTGFTVWFLTFISFCIDYPRLSHAKTMNEVIVSKCTKKINGFWTLLLWIFIVYWMYSLIATIRSLPKLRNMQNFFHHLLDIPDRDIQSVDWTDVIGRLMALREYNFITASNIPPDVRRVLNDRSRQTLDAYGIVNRLMRQENYLIALFNKEILDVTIPIPFLGPRYMFSQTTEWHMRLAVLDWVFNGPGNQLNHEFLKERNRRNLVRTLQARFKMTGIISLFCAPFAVVYVLTSYLFKYFTEFRADPSRLGARDFTPFAQWKFREFNELHHQFIHRRNMAYPFADRYLAQFPKDKTEQLMAFVAYVTGALATALAFLTLFDSELFLGIEITPGRNGLFYLTLLVGIYRAARSSSAQEQEVQDPTWYLNQVISHTHYEPASWKNRLHTDEVRAQFSALYQPKLSIFLEEILSMVVTPFILMFRLPKCSERIVDFFREFTINVDGLGNVCSFALFDFNKGTDNASANPGGPRQDLDLRADYYRAKDDKMLMSYHGFLGHYGGQGQGRFNGRLQGRGSFHPPPAFPNQFGAVPSPTQGPTVVGQQSARTSSRGPASKQPIQRRLHRQDAPMNSVLLDPQHQPSMSSLRHSPHQVPQSRYRTTLQPLSGPREDESVPAPAKHGVPAEEHSSIGDSWRTSRLAQDDDEEEQPTTANRPAGVLQLIQQYSKAQTEGRGAGTGI